MSDASDQVANQTVVQFQCQACRSPMRVGPSLKTLSAETLSRLSRPQRPPPPSTTSSELVGGTGEEVYRALAGNDDDELSTVERRVIRSFLPRPSEHVDVDNAPSADHGDDVGAAAGAQEQEEDKEAVEGEDKQNRAEEEGDKEKGEEGLKGRTEARPDDEGETGGGDDDDDDDDGNGGGGGGDSEREPSSLEVSSFSPGDDQTAAAADKAASTTKTSKVKLPDGLQALMLTDTLSHHVKVLTRLFDLMTGNSDYDFPLCIDCAEALAKRLEKSIAESDAECKRYEAFLARYELGAVTLPSNANELDREEQALAAEEAQLEAQLAQLEGERTVAQAELERAQRSAMGLEDDLEQYWMDYNDLYGKLDAYAEERDSIEMRFRLAQTQLDQLKGVNVLNHAFYISHINTFGTINGLRLGRLPTHPVEWSEINAAWGLTSLLLQTLATRLKFRFKKYRIVANGSFSRIEKFDERNASRGPQHLELFGSGGIKFFWASRFDQAMVAFLDCLQQFKEHIEAVDDHCRLPYKIDKDRVGELSVKMQFNNEESWTRALRKMLCNLKWALAWVVKAESP